MATETAALVGCPVEQVLVSSTGVIGVALPMAKIHQGIPVAFTALGSDHGSLAAQAIMTTDPFPKEAAARVGINGGEITIGGRHRHMRARVATPEERGALWPRIVEVYRDYGNYQTRTTREIPVVILEPRP